MALAALHQIRTPSFANRDRRHPTSGSTHLGARVCPCHVNFKHLTVKAEQGVIFGTTVRRAREMAAEAGLRLSISSRNAASRRPMSHGA